MKAMTVALDAIYTALERAPEWVIAYSLEGEVVERETFAGSNWGAMAQADHACQTHWDNTADTLGDGPHIVGQKLTYTIAKKGE